MKKYCTLFFLYCVVLLIPVLCHASDWDFDSDGDVDGKDLYLLTGTFSSDDLEPFVAAFGSVGSLEVTCGAYVAPGVWKKFDCYNLGAIGKTTGDDPFTPSWRLNGGYWQWGRKGPDSSQWYNTNTPNFAHGPTGPEGSNANKDAIAGWDLTLSPDGSLSNIFKTANDPCPSGYRMPTRSQWSGIVTNNPQSIVGTWSDSSRTWYSAARFFGNSLMLPAAGYRFFYNGSLGGRGLYGAYWSSTENAGNGHAWDLYFYRGYASSDYLVYRNNGYSVRCVAE